VLIGHLIEDLECDYEDEGYKISIPRHVGHEPARFKTGKDRLVVFGI
jgi:hypothetical protein